MKRITVLAIILIIANCLSICLFAYEATEDEEDVIMCASQFIIMCDLTQTYDDSDFDFLPYTFEYKSEERDFKAEVIEKAKEYEDEIRKHYYYYFEHENVTDKSVYEDEKSSLYGCDPAKDPFALQFNDIPIEEIITSFPIFTEKKIQYMRAYNSFLKTLKDGEVSIDWGVPGLAPRSVFVSESGFAYVEFNGWRVLLYKWKSRKEGAFYGIWKICDVYNNIFDYDRKYRFSSREMDVEKELSLVKESMLEDHELKEETESDSEKANGVTSPQESDSEADTTPKDSKPINYIPWAVCAVEGVAVIALVIALVVLKKRK